MKKYIVLSVNDNPDYLFHVPLVCWAWEQLGWWPIVFYAGEITPLADYVFRFTFEEYDGSFVHGVDVPPGYKSETTAQVSRLYGCCVADGGLLMTSDIDMLPLSDYWKPNENEITCYGRDLSDEHQPICYVAMSSADWHKTMDLCNHDYNKMIERDLKRTVPKAKNVWCVDQDILTENLNDLPDYYKKTIVRIDRGTDKRTRYPIGRIDRSHWTLDHKQYIDAHLFHDVHRNEDSFKKTLQMLHTVWPKEDFKWWIQYTKEFKKLCQNKSQFAQ